MKVPNSCESLGMRLRQVAMYRSMLQEMLGRSIRNCHIGCAVAMFWLILATGEGMNLDLREMMMLMPISVPLDHAQYRRMSLIHYQS
jgi:hypothetical protein